MMEDGGLDCSVSRWGYLLGSCKQENELGCHKIRNVS